MHESPIWQSTLTNATIWAHEPPWLAPTPSRVERAHPTTVANGLMSDWRAVASCYNSRNRYLYDPRPRCSAGESRGGGQGLGGVRVGREGSLLPRKAGGFSSGVGENASYTGYSFPGSHHHTWDPEPRRHYLVAPPPLCVWPFNFTGLSLFPFRARVHTLLTLLSICLYTIFIYLSFVFIFINNNMCLFISFHSTLSPFLLFSDKYIPTHTNITTYTDVCVWGGGVRVCVRV